MLAGPGAIQDFEDDRHCCPCTLYIVNGYNYTQSRYYSPQLVQAFNWK